MTPTAQGLTRERIEALKERASGHLSVDDYYYHDDIIDLCDMALRSLPVPDAETDELCKRLLISEEGWYDQHAPDTPKEARNSVMRDAVAFIHRQVAHIAALTADNAKSQEALTEIACFGDTHANDKLKNTGSYGGFDEPISVQIARATLKQNDRRY